MWLLVILYMTCYVFSSELFFGSDKVLSFWQDAKYSKRKILMTFSGKRGMQVTILFTKRPRFWTIQFEEYKMESGSFREWNCAFGWILLFSTILSICSSQDYDTLKPSKIYKCCPGIRHFYHLKTKKFSTTTHFYWTFKIILENKYFDLTTKRYVFFMCHIFLSRFASCYRRLTKSNQNPHFFSCKNADESILYDTKVQRECPLDEADLIEVSWKVN